MFWDEKLTVTLMINKIYTTVYYGTRTHGEIGRGSCCERTLTESDVLGTAGAMKSRNS